MADFFNKKRDVAWDEVREDMTQMIAFFEEWCADEVDFGVNPDDAFSTAGAEVNGVRRVVEWAKDIVDKMEMS